MRKRYKTSFSRVIFYSSKLSPILHPPTSRNVGAQEGHHLLKRLAFDLLSKRWFLTWPERVEFLLGLACQVAFSDPNINHLILTQIVLLDWAEARPLSDVFSIPSNLSMAFPSLDSINQVSPDDTCLYLVFPRLFSHYLHLRFFVPFFSTMHTEVSGMTESFENIAYYVNFFILMYSIHSNSIIPML